MRIDDLNRAGQTQGAEKIDSGTQKRANDKQASFAGGDLAEVSQLAHALGTKDPGRIEQLRLAIQSGKYEVSANDVAKAIIDAHFSE